MKQIYAVIFWLMLFNVFVYSKPYDTFSLRSSPHSPSLNPAHAAVIKTKSLGTQSHNQHLVSYANPLPRSTQPTQATQKISQNLAPIKPVNQSIPIVPVNTSDQTIVNQLQDLYDFYNQKNGTCDNAILTQRISALKTTLANPIIYNHSYQLSSDALSLLSVHSYDKNIHEQCTGNEFQHVMQNQLNDIVEQLANYNKKVPRFYSTLHDASIDFVHAGTIANNNGYIKKAISLADFCFATLDLFKATGEGIVAGTVNSSSFVYHCVTSPVTMIKEVAQGIGYLSLLFLDVLSQYDDELISYYTPRSLSNNSSISAIVLNDLIGKMLATKPYDLTRAVIKNGTALVVEGMITELVLVAVGKLARNAAVNGTELLKNLAGKVPETGEYAIALAEATEVKITEQAAEQFFTMIEKEKQAGSVVKSPHDYSHFWKNPTAPIKEELIQTFSQSQKVKELEARVMELNKTVPDTRYGKVLTLEIPFDKIQKILNEADLFYNNMRLNNEDVLLIAKNTGIRRELIQQIKNHLFFEEHILSEGIQRFHPDADMKMAWQRLIENDFVQSDLRLLLHEYAESLIMQGIKVSYENAHYILDTIYGWKDFI